MGANVPAVWTFGAVGAFSASVLVRPICMLGNHFVQTARRDFFKSQATVTTFRF